MNHPGWLMVICAILSACNPPDPGGLTPEASFRFTPESGKTTDTFRFDASFSRSGSLTSKMYFRWDWNRDGTWDEEFSRIPVIGYRFYRKGTYNPVLEVMNSDGLTDTLSLTLTVAQGYSAPKPSFTVTPERGNLKTLFHLDASSSKDDEDSVGQLRFMWDFTGNGSWDTPLSANTSAKIYYQDTGKFEVALEAVDPQNMRRTVTRSIWVTNINPRLVADFIWTPEHGTTSTDFTLDASASYSLDDPHAVLRYSWKLPSTNFEWTEWSNQPLTTFGMKREATYELELRVMDTASLVNYCKKIITIYHQNLPPSPKFIIGCSRGNIRTQFFFNSWPSIDPESLPTSIEVRWDFDGDLNWDTYFSKERTIYHNYPEAGVYKISMEARDPDGLSDIAAQFVEVSPWTNETGLILDQRDGQYYGSVKIGDQWWMSQNLNFAPFDRNKDEVRKLCYSRFWNDPIQWCNSLGGLYNCYHATREDFYGEVRGICPSGWHIPSRKEWETLVGSIGGWDQADKLLPGGTTDFNALYAGCAEEISDPIEGKIIVFKWINYATYYWSFNKMSNPYAPNSWSLTLIKGEKKFYPGFSGMENYYSVRCVKDVD